MAKIIENPFNPGPGAEPLYIAGRQRERGLIEEALLRITDLDPSDGIRLGLFFPIKIVGPRGVGKTTLLYEAARLAQSHKIEVLNLAQLDSLADPDLLIGLVGEKAHKRLLDKLAKSRGMSDGPPDIVWELHYLHLEQSFRKKTAGRPLLLLLDELMHYEPKALGGLLRICHTLIRDEQPLAVIMAGTPETDQLLDQLSATYVEDVIDIDINALSDAETLDALARPFEMLGAKATSAALRRMVELSDNYPFFIQIVGSEVWKVMSATSKREASLALVKQAEPVINRKRRNLHGKIQAWIINNGLHKHSERAMEILAMNQGKVKRVTMISGLAGKKKNVFGPEHVEIFNQLLDRGLIWTQGGEVEAGLPSFFDYCQQKAKKSKKAAI